MSVSTPPPPIIEAPAPRRSAGVRVAAVGVYVLVLVAFWFVAQHFGMEARIGGHLPSSFVSFAMLLAPYWFFGFGAADYLRGRLQSTWSLVLTPGLLVVPYLVFSVPRGETTLWLVFALFAIPVGLAALFTFVPPGGRRGGTQKICWQDAIALTVVGFPVEFHMFSAAFPHPGLSAMSKFLLVDAVLYAYLVVRQLDGVGFDFRARARDIAIGLREWCFYAPIAIALGSLMGFIAFHRRIPSAATALSALLITFFFVAIPEELFFRGLLQNMLEARIGKHKALLIASVIFGLSHFNKPLPFNWRYVVMATIAGTFYARAWRDRRRLFSSGTTHTLVDVVWSLWWR